MLPRKYLVNFSLLTKSFTSWHWFSIWWN